MIAAAREALRRAALAGVPQLYGALLDAHGGYCAGGVVTRLYPVDYRSWAGAPVAGCPLCREGVSPVWLGTRYWSVPRCEWDLLVHLNNVHACDFLKIAELMPVTTEP